MRRAPAGLGEQWLVTDRERLRQLRLHLLEEEAQRQAREGHFGLALEAAFAPCRSILCGRPPIAESSRSIWRKATSPDTRRAYRTCRRVLIDDVGVVPSDATTGLMRSDWHRGIVAVRGQRRMHARSHHRTATPAPWRGH